MRHCSGRSFSQSGLLSFGYTEIAITVLLFNAIASRMNFLEVAIPKSHVLALNFHVFLSENLFLLLPASACVTITTGLSNFF
jgi:hypothetical protein